MLKKGQGRRQSMRFDPSVGGNDPFAGNPRRICFTLLSFWSFSPSVKEAFVSKTRSSLRSYGLKSAEPVL